MARAVMTHGSGKSGWIGVDFDRTLATYIDWETNGEALGKPIPLMVERVKRWLQQGQEVRIFTARAARNSARRLEDIAKIQNWCKDVFGQALKVTAEKDFACYAIWDDRAVTVEPNTGLAVADSETDPLSYEEEIVMAYDVKVPVLIREVE